jgi:hypothetical protein
MKAFIKAQWNRIPVRLRDGVIIVICTAAIIFFVQFVRGYVNEYDTMRAERDKYKVRIEAMDKADAEALNHRLTQCAQIENMAADLENLRGRK